MQNDIILETKNLCVDYPVKKRSFFEKRKVLSAVSDVSIKIMRGETFGLVGESGCGKSTFADTTLGFVKPSGGEVLYAGKKIEYGDAKNIREVRKHMQKIFQDPNASLNPRFTVRDIICEPVRIRKNVDKTEADRLAEDIIQAVGLSVSDLDRYASDFSGGQQQRIAIARALILKPEYIVCDEPVSALDVSVHAQILNLLMDMQKKTGTTYLFISHNLAVVKKICSRIAIMYMGKVVEYGNADAIYNNPKHPYTKALLSAVLDIDSDKTGNRIILKGDVASPIDVPAGCRFAARCPVAKTGCSAADCRLTEVESEHFVACPYSC